MFCFLLKTLAINLGYLFGCAAVLMTKYMKVISSDNKMVTRKTGRFVLFLQKLQFAFYIEKCGACKVKSSCRVQCIFFLSTKEYYIIYISYKVVPDRVLLYSEICFTFPFIIFLAGRCVRKAIFNLLVMKSKVEFAHEALNETIRRPA